LFCIFGEVWYGFIGQNATSLLFGPFGFAVPPLFPLHEPFVQGEWVEGEHGVNDEQGDGEVDVPQTANSRLFLLLQKQVDYRGGQTEGEKSVTKPDMGGVDLGQVRNGLGDIPLDSHSRCSSSPNFGRFRRTGRRDWWVQVHCAQPLMPIL